MNVNHAMNCVAADLRTATGMPEAKAEELARYLFREDGEVAHLLLETRYTQEAWFDAEFKRLPVVVVIPNFTTSNPEPSTEIRDILGRLDVVEGWINKKSEGRRAPSEAERRIAAQIVVEGDKATRTRTPDWIRKLAGNHE